MTAEDPGRFRRERQDADAAYNGALTELDRAIVAMNTRPFDQDEIQRVATALIVFLQQITPFVDTKHRELASDLATEIRRVQRELDSIGEMRTHLGVVQRSLQALRRQNARSPQPSALDPQPSPLSPQPSALSPEPSALS